MELNFWLLEHEQLSTHMSCLGCLPTQTPPTRPLQLQAPPLMGPIELPLIVAQGLPSCTFWPPILHHSSWACVSLSW